MWLKNKLEEVSTFISRGISPKYIEKGGIRVLNQKCIRNHVINYDLARRHNFELKKFSEDRFIKKGDVLINSTGQGTLGRVAQVREDPKELTTVDSHITIVRPKEELFYLEYFGYSAIAIEKIIKNYGQGASGQTELAKSKVQNELEISFPISLKEQKNIVAKLDHAFTEIDKSLEIKRILLLENKKLFKSLLESCFNENFKGMKIGDLGEVSSGGTPSSKNRDYWEGDIQWYSSGELNNKFTKKSIKRITNEGLINSNAKLFPKDSLLVGMYDTAAMKMSILREESTFNQAIVGIAPNKIVSTEYLLFTLTYLKNSILQQRRGVRQQNLSLAKIKNIEFPIPTPEIQESIVKKLDFVSKQNIFYKGYLSEIIENLLSLKSSVLTKALKFEI